MKKIIRYLLPVWLILLGTGLLGYPWISQYLFDNRTDSIIHTYEAVSEETDGFQLVGACPQRLGGRVEEEQPAGQK